MKFFSLFVVFCLFFVAQTSDLPKFPKSFLFGTATSSYQIEGAAKTDGRAPSIWDTFSHTPNKTHKGETGDIACDHYHKFKEDVQLMKEIGFKVYRFSISWSRILPTGRLPLNQKGVDFYNQLIDDLIKNKLIPFVTLYHWDLPQHLQDEYKGLLSERFVGDFANYAKLCYQLFGDRVKHWITFNEPYILAVRGSDVGVMAPGRCSDRKICKEGNSSTEIYQVSHNLLNAHAMAYHLYKNEFYSTQKGEIGITLYTEWHEPRTTKPEDIEAAKRVQEFQLGWYADPVYFGDYPSVMKKILGSKLPTFTQRQKELLKGSSDFLGINHYTSRYATNGQIEKEGWQKDTHTVSHLTDTNGKLIGKLEHPEWLYNVPWGFRKLLNHSWRRYRAPIYITENGLAEVNDPKKPLEEALKDPHRINYYKSYLTEVHNAMKEGADIRGYMAWSLMDNFEWADGYSARFGIHFVDFKNLKRYQKLSAKWWKSELIAQQ